jgi:hypothetical protein
MRGREKGEGEVKKDMRKLGGEGEDTQGGSKAGPSHSRPNDDYVILRC